MSIFGDIYRNKKVLVTGHTGFKGSWLTLWLEKMGAKVLGVGLEPATTPAHFNLINFDCDSRFIDIVHTFSRSFQVDFTKNFGLEAICKSSRI